MPRGETRPRLFRVRLDADHGAEVSKVPKGEDIILL